MPSNLRLRGAGYVKATQRIMWAASRLRLCGGKAVSESPDGAPNRGIKCISCLPPAYHLESLMLSSRLIPTSGIHVLEQDKSDWLHDHHNKMRFEDTV